MTVVNSVGPEGVFAVPDRMPAGVVAAPYAPLDWGSTSSSGHTGVYKFVTARDLVRASEFVSIRLGAVGVWNIDRAKVFFRRRDLICIDVNVPADGLSEDLVLNNMAILEIEDI